MNITEKFKAISGLLCICITVFSQATIASTAKKSIDYEIMVQRATQAAIWAMPAVSIRGIENAIRADLGGDSGDIVYFSKPMESRHGFLTANNQTAYAVAAFTTEDGPQVVEVPAAAEKVSFFGSFVNAWQTPIADVGPAGDDKGKGGRYLFLPPGYDGEVPDGYMVYRPDTYSVNMVFRPVTANDGTLSDVRAYTKSLKTYKLSEADKPPPTRYIDAYPKVWNTQPNYDISYFHTLADIINTEPVLARDKAMMAMLAGIGINKGQLFKPDTETTRALEEGIKLAYASMQSFFITPGKAMVPYWKGKQWQIWNFADGQAEAGFPYETEDRVLIDERAGGSYFWITYLPKKLGGGSFYLTELRDRAGKLLDGTSTYRLRVPADTPARDFWSVIVYSIKSKGFVKNVERVGLSSLDRESLQFNDNGSVDIYFSPTAPQGRESNWIPTGEDFFLLFRLYGPQSPLFDRTWILGDIENLSP